MLLLAAEGYDLPSGEDIEVDTSAADSEAFPLNTEALDGTDAAELKEATFSKVGVERPEDQASRVLTRSRG